MFRFPPKRSLLVRLLSGLGPPPPPRRYFSNPDYGGRRRRRAGAAARPARDAERAAG